MMKRALIFSIALLSFFAFTANAKPRKFWNSFDYREHFAKIPTEGNDAFKRNYRLALRGNASAQNEVGVAYYNPEDGVRQNYSNAMIWFRRAALQGHTLAQANFGDLYYFGRGVARDYAEAFRWYTPAAEKGNPLAMSYLAELYAEGWGVDQNLEEAARWNHRAIKTYDFLAVNNAAWFFSTVEREDLLEPSLAIDLMEQIVQISQDPEYLDTLAAAYAANGEFDKAVKTQETAISRKTEEEGSASSEYLHRLDLYRDRQRYIHFKTCDTQQVAGGDATR